LNVDAISSVIVALTALFIVIFRADIAPAFAGLALAYSLQLPTLLQYAVRVTLEAENFMTSVERLTEWQTSVPVGSFLVVLSTFFFCTSL
jgi:hypothetical protein